MTDHQRARADLHHYLRLIWRWKWLLVGIIVLIPSAVYLITKSSPKTYQASSTLLVQGTTIEASVGTNRISVSTSSPEDIAQLINTPVIADVAAENLGLPASEGRSLLGSITAELDPASEGGGPEATRFLTITASAEEPERSVELAEAFSDAVVGRRTSDARRAIGQTIDDLSSADQIAELGPSARQGLVQNIQALQAARATIESKTQIVNPAVPPAGPIAPAPRRNAALGFIFALLLAAGMVPLLDRLDRKIREVDELERLAEAPLLAMIPEAAFPGRRSGPHVREAFQTLRAGLTYFNVDRSLDSVVVASPSHGEGKTTVAMHLAVALAQDGREVILVDGDMRRARIARRFGIDASIGLEAVLLGEGAIERALVDVDRVEGGRLRILPAVSSPPDPSVLLGSDHMRSVLSELSAISDIVVIDTPALLIVSDAIPLLEQASGVVLVARINQSARDAVQKSRQVITTARGTMVGVVATGTMGAGLYGYSDYEYGEDGEAAGESLPSRLKSAVTRVRSTRTPDRNGARGDAVSDGSGAPRKSERSGRPS